MTIKNNLKKFREKNRLQQSEVATYLNISVRQYRNIESETPKSVNQFYQLAKLFNTTIDSLLKQNINNTEK